MKVKVPLFRSVRSVIIDTDATSGAVLGENLFNPDGSLVDIDAMIAAQLADAGIDPSQPDTGISLDDVQMDGDGIADVAGSLAQGSVTVGIDLARNWMFG
jgi:hypothetical protein